MASEDDVRQLGHAIGLAASNQYPKTGPPPDGAPFNRLITGSVLQQVLSENIPQLADALDRAIENLHPTPIKPGDEWKKKWKTKPVNVVDFCRYWLKEPLWPRQELAALQLWGQDPNVWRDKDCPTKVLLQWGKGSGKDRTIAKMFCFAAYRLENLINPWLEFDKPEGDPIDVINVSFNADQAKKVFFKHLKAMMRKTLIPGTRKNWFADMGIDLKEGGKNVQSRSIVLVPGVEEGEDLITLHAGDSKVNTGEGLNLIFALFDELGVMAPVTHAVELFNALWDTVTSRFKEAGCVVGISYKYAENDAMEVEFQAAEKQIEDDILNQRKPTAFVDRAATWEVNLTTTRQTFASQYLRNPERAQRVYECIGGGSEHAFFKFREEVRGRCNIKRKSPIVGDVYKCADPSQLVFEKWFVGIPGARYHAHIDLATGKSGNDKVGLFLAHTFDSRPKWSEDYLTRLQIVGEPEPQGSGDFRKAVFADLILQIVSPGQGEVQFSGIIDLLVRLKGLGFEMSVSYDGWQSKGEIQRLQALGFSAECISVDKTPEPANTAKQLWYSGLVDVYAHPTLLREAEELEEDPKTGKVDHPEKSKKRMLEEGEPNGSKDVWDAFAATCWVLTTGEGGGYFDIGFGGQQESTMVAAGTKVIEAEVWR